MFTSYHQHSIFQLVISLWTMVSGGIKWKNGQKEQIGFVNHRHWNKTLHSFKGKLIYHENIFAMCPFSLALSLLEIVQKENRILLPFLFVSKGYYSVIVEYISYSSSLFYFWILQCANINLWVNNKLAFIQKWEMISHLL